MSAVPALAAALFGIKGARAGKSLYNQFKGIGKRLEKSQQVPGAKVKKPQIKTAKPPKVKPTVPAKVSVSPEEKSQVMSWFGNSGGAYKTGSALTPKTNLTPKLKPSAKAKMTKLGKKMDTKNPGSIMFDTQSAIKKDLPKTPWKQNSEARDLFGL